MNEPEDPCDLVCHPEHGACCGGKPMNATEDRSEWHPQDSLPRRVGPDTPMFDLGPLPAEPQENSPEANSRLQDLKTEIVKAQREQALLGLATTRELLEELRARFAVRLIDAPEWASLLSQCAGAGANFLLANLPKDMLNCRTAGDE